MLTRIIKNWDWVECTQGSYLESDLLKRYGFKHGFFNKRFQYQNPEKLSKVLGENLSIHSCKQIHGNNVIEASVAKSCQTIEADGLLSDKPKQSLWIASADCIPILIADNKTRNVAACHAGWRGISKGILREVLSKLRIRGSQLNSIIIALGPAISGKNYQVDDSVANSIYQSVSNDNSISSNNSESIKRLIKLGILEHDKDPDRFLLDIRLAAFHQLIQSGLNGNQISICPICTFAEPNIFHSRRRDNLKKIQWSGIVSSDN